MTDLVFEEVETFWVRIYIGGDFHVARQVCREQCLTQGLCVTIAPLTYVYTGGEESGVVVGLINYPRFPSEADEMTRRARHLGETLMRRLCQRSFSLMTPNKTVRYSRDGAPL